MLSYTRTMCCLLQPTTTSQQRLIHQLQRNKILHHKPHISLVTTFEFHSNHSRDRTATVWCRETGFSHTFHRPLYNSICDEEEALQLGASKCKTQCVSQPTETTVCVPNHMIMDRPHGFSTYQKPIHVCFQYTITNQTPVYLCHGNVSSNLCVFLHC